MLKISHLQKHYRGFSLDCSMEVQPGMITGLIGRNGSGKSTTALSLIRRGYQYLADDIVMLRPLDSPNIVPAYPLQKVCGDVAEQLPPEQLLYINEQRDKYAYLNRKDYCHQPKKLSSIFIIRADDEDTVRVEEITGLNKYLRTLECLFLAEVYADVGTPDGDKFQCLKIAEQVRFYMIKRPKYIDTVEQVADCIESLVAD